MRLRLGHRWHLLRGRSERARNVERDGFCLICVPRTSTTALQTELVNRFGPIHGKDSLGTPLGLSAYPAHLTALEMRRQLGAAWNRIFSFSVVRNPFDRHLSFYRFRTQAEHSLPEGTTFDAYLRLLAMGRFGYPPHRLNAFDFVSDGRQVIVSKIVRFEDRASGLAEIGQRIGLPSLGTLKANDTNGRDYRSEYSSEGRAIIEAVCRDDLEAFSYSF